MITAIPKDQAIEKKDLEKDYQGITKERLIGMNESIAKAMIMDSCILDEIERDIDNIDGLAIRMLIRKRIKTMSNKMDNKKAETKK